jgi:hypothetical protein
MVGGIGAVPVPMAHAEEPGVESVQHWRVYALKHAGTRALTPELHPDVKARTEPLLVLIVQALLYVAPALLRRLREAPLVPVENQFGEVVDRDKRHPVLAEVAGQQQLAGDRELFDEEDELSVAIAPVPGAKIAASVDRLCGAVAHHAEHILGSRLLSRKAALRHRSG